MAFDLKYLERVQASNNLDVTLNVKAGSDLGNNFNIWKYNASSGGADDTKAETVAADYFLSAYGVLGINDRIECACSDGNQLVIVTASSSVTVTTSAAWAV
jgi:hypothetical protein